METLYAANCSADYLAAIQWGSSAVTNSDFISNQDATYFPKSLTVKDWDLPGVVNPPEYYYYSTEIPATNPTPLLSYEQVMNITSSNYNYGGLNNTYNSKMLFVSSTRYQDYYTNYVDDLLKIYGLGNTMQLSFMIQSMEE
jgi:hypothetical protein